LKPVRQVSFSIMVWSTVRPVALNSKVTSPVVGISAVAMAVTPKSTSTL
jgi:hypothetical protein